MNLKKLKALFFNTLDVAIIIIAISIVVAAIFSINGKRIRMLFDASQDCVISVSAISGELTSDDFKVGQKIYLSDTEETVGTIVSVKNIKEKRYSAINNTLMYDYSDKNIGVLIEIRTKIKQSQSKKYINSSVFVAPGTRYVLDTKEVSAFECVVDDVNIISEQ